MSRLLVIPAAGLGSRLKTSTPKPLVAVNGRPMLDHLFDLYRPHVERMVVVAHPSFLPDIERWAEGKDMVDVTTQGSPTGMLDAILLAMPFIELHEPESVWITWCDQVGVLRETLGLLAAWTRSNPPPALALPTVQRRDPYIHLVRNREGRIVEVLHKREGDQLPSEGESDMGVFALSRDAYERLLPEYAREVTVGRGTGERNFLPFIAWLVGRGVPLLTFPCTDPMEAIGINTPEELTLVEGWLRTRSSRPS